MHTANHNKRVRLASVGIIAVLVLLLSVLASPIFAQTPAPAAPTNLVAELTDTDGEVQLTWDAADGATQYRACRRAQGSTGNWTCVSTAATHATFTGLTVGTTYDFAVASYDGKSYSSWVWTEATVETVVHICPITGLPVPDGYLSVNEKTIDPGGREFTLTSVSKKSTIRVGGEIYYPNPGRAYLKVCGKVKAPSYSMYFVPGTANNLATDKGIGFNYPDEGSTDWLDVGEIPANQTRSACDIWDIASDAATAIYTVNNFSKTHGVYQVGLP